MVEDVDNDLVSAVVEDHDNLNIQEGLIAGKREKRSPRKMGGKGRLKHGKKCPRGFVKRGRGCKKNTKKG